MDGMSNTKAWGEQGEAAARPGSEVMTRERKAQRHAAVGRVAVPTQARQTGAGPKPCGRHGRGWARWRVGHAAPRMGAPRAQPVLLRALRLTWSVPTMNKPHDLPASLSPANLSEALQLPDVVNGLRAAREEWRNATHRNADRTARELPSPELMAEFMAGLRKALFPMRLGPSELLTSQEDGFIASTLERVLGLLLTQVQLELSHQTRLGQTPQVPDAVSVVRSFAQALPQIRRLLDSDVMAAFHGDPAARSVDEVLLAYPGILAMSHHRVAHQLYGQGMALLARLVSEQAHSATGIDIHPGAQIGPGFFIDHGTGVVIGETAIIGRNVRVYQAVTLGAKRFASDEHGHLVKGGARHPILEDDVVVYAGATILGRVTIGQGSSIGGNVWLTRSVPPGSHIAQAQARDCGPDDAGLATSKP